jgi:hypothetical protein
MKKNILLGLACMQLLVSTIIFAQPFDKTIVCEGTTILVSISKRDVAIAADSKIVNRWKYDWSNDVQTFITAKCKIRHVGNFFFAAAGQVGAYKKSFYLNREIDVLNTISSMNLEKYESFEEKVKYVESSLKPYVEEIIQMLNIPPSDKPFLIVIFASYERNKPKMANIKYFTRNKTVVDFGPLTRSSYKLPGSNSPFIPTSTNTILPSDLGSIIPDSFIETKKSDKDLIRNLNEKNLITLHTNPNQLSGIGQLLTYKLIEDKKDDKNLIQNLIEKNPPALFTNPNQLSTISQLPTYNLFESMKDDKNSVKNLTVKNQLILYSYTNIQSDPNFGFVKSLIDYKKKEEESLKNLTAINPQITNPFTSQLPDLTSTFTKSLMDNEKKYFEQFKDTGTNPFNNINHNDTIHSNAFKQFTWPQPSQMPKTLLSNYSNSQMPNSLGYNTIYYGLELDAITEFYTTAPHNYRFGHTDAIDGEFSSQDQAFSISKLEELITKEIDDPIGTSIVGHPIDIVTINSKGFKWIKKKQECD